MRTITLDGRSLDDGCRNVVFVARSNGHGEETGQDAMRARAYQIHRSRLHVVLGVMAIASLATGLPGPARAQSRSSRTIRSVGITSTETGWRLEIEFEFGIRYLRHTPSDRNGRLLRILIDPLGIGGFDPNPGALRELVPIPRRGESPVVEVAYDVSVPGRPAVELQFSRALFFEVEPTDGLTRLVVHASILQPPRESPDAEPSAPGGSTERSLRLLARARHAIRDGELSLAISLLSKILEQSREDTGTEIRAQARELLGIAHERGGQEAHARAEYQAYLEEFPTGPGADRVRQRLEALETAAAAPRAPLEEPSGTARPTLEETTSRPEVDAFGSLALTYFRWESMLDRPGPEFLSTNLLADADLAGRIDADDWAVRGDFTGTYDKDVSGDGRSDDLRISRLSIEAVDRVHGLELTLGRQRRSDGGVIGRFDGARAAYQIEPRVGLAALVGLPVESTSDKKPNTDTIMAGGSVDIEDVLLEGLRGHLFVIGQQTESIMDRTAIGGEIRFSNAKTYSFAYLDYDMLFNSLNTAILSSTWYWTRRTDFRALIERRNAPILTLQTALQGQTARDLDELSDLLSDSDIRDLAVDRTLVIHTGTFGATHRPNDRLQLSTDLTIVHIGGTNSSVIAGSTETIEGVDDAGPEVGVSVEALLNDWLIEGGVGSVSLRHFEGENTRAFDATAFSRFPLFDGFRASPRLRWTLRDSDLQGVASTLRPTLELDWRHGALLLNADAGIEWFEPIDENDGTSDRETSYFVELGARWEF